MRGSAGTGREKALRRWDRRKRREVKSASPLAPADVKFCWRKVGNRMEIRLLLLALICIHASFRAFAEQPEEATVIVKGSTRIAETDDNYVCATIDWWPPEKCNYNQCPWGQSSILNLDLDHPFLAQAIQAFDNLRIRLGGSLQDRVVYDVGTDSPCTPFRNASSGLFGFSVGCLTMDRWGELNDLFQKTGSTAPTFAASRVLAEAAAGWTAGLPIGQHIEGPFPSALRWFDGGLSYSSSGPDAVGGIFAGDSSCGA